MSGGYGEIIASVIVAFRRQGDYYKFESKLGYMVVSEVTLGYQRDPFSNEQCALVEASFKNKFILIMTGGSSSKKY